MPPQRDVRVLRGGRVESVHVLDLCVVDGDGALLYESTPGIAGSRVFLRSAAKPFQAVASVAAGVVERFSLDDRHLAVACASHTGTAEHVRAVTEILAAASLGVANLDCGLPDAGEPVTLALVGRGEQPSPLHHNCSGNHALALAWCVAAGAPTAGYLAPGHPVQVAMRRAVVSAAGGEQPDEAIDGCGMRAYRLALGTVAAMYGRLATAAGDVGRCRAAMRAHPALVRGDGSIDTELMRGVPGLVAKVGAEALIGIGLRDGRGVGLKVRDGGFRALDPAAVAIVRELGEPAASAALESLAAPAVTNARGEAVGSIVLGGASTFDP